MGIIAGNHIRVVNNVFDEIGFMVVDIEPGGSGGEGASDVVFSGNDVGSYGLTDQDDAWLLAACGKSGSNTIRDVTVTGNTIEGNRTGQGGVKALHLRICGDRGPRENFTVTDNVAHSTVDGPSMHFVSVRGVTVTGNTQPLSKGELATFPGSTNVTYRR